MDDLTQFVDNLFKDKKGTSKQLDELTSRLQLTNKPWNESEVKQHKDEDEKKLLDDHIVLAYEADQAMDKINTEALWRKGEDDEQSGRKAKSAWSKPQGLTPNLLAQLQKIMNVHTSSPSRVAHRTHSAKAMSSGKTNKEAMSPDEIMARMTRRKAAARKGKSILSTIKPIMLDDEPLATPSWAHFSTPQSHKRKRDESCIDLNVPDGLPPQQNFSAAAQIGGALKTQVDFDSLSNCSFAVLLEEYVGRAVQNHQLTLAMSAKYTAMELGHTTLIKERDGLLAKLEDERRIAIDLEDELRARLDKAEKLLTEKYERIFELIEEGKEQYADGWSHARLVTLLQHRDGKLSEKETADEIQRLMEYFSDSENEDILSRLDDVVQVATCLADDENTTGDSQEQVSEKLEEGS